MKFYPNQWMDPLTGENVENPRASTESIFDEDLNIPITYDAGASQFTSNRLFSLNYLNFDQAYEYLIPKAVAYSAGLLNYFFRGSMKIELPADGVYAVVDHKLQGCRDYCGFTNLKLRLTNTTPNEDMRAGNVFAVVKFHRNLCYRDDLSGDPGGPSFLDNFCLSRDEEITVSEPVAIALLKSGEQRELPFRFLIPVPINASDVYLQVVFLGQLGLEQGAVAVETKDISEPNYFAITNITDMVYDFAGHRFVALPYLGYNAPDTIYGLKLTFAAGRPPAATIGQLTAPGHAQVGVLTDLGTQYIDIQYTSQRYTVPRIIHGDVPVSAFTAPPDIAYHRTVEFEPSRGVFRNIYVYHRYPMDFTVYDCNVEPELCAETTMPPFLPASASEWTITF